MRFHSARAADLTDSVRMERPRSHWHRQRAQVATGYPGLKIAIRLSLLAGRLPLDLVRLVLDSDRPIRNHGVGRKVAVLYQALEPYPAIVAYPGPEEDREIAELKVVARDCIVVKRSFSAMNEAPEPVAAIPAQPDMRMLQGMKCHSVFD